MKAKLPQSVTGKGPFHGHDIRLTIGMIVKNEEKTLDRCLRSLQPLMDAVPSELIITDTGSTDKTVEIARNYTDNILFFEWCNDFSAARNTGLKAARGEWFMFLDADEWFETTDGLVEFFTSGKCDRYGASAYTIRNYVDPEGKKYDEGLSLRVFRMYPDIAFQNAVHEELVRKGPIYYSEDRVDHCGYAFRNEEDKRKKVLRNQKLLEQEIEENPHDLKAYFQLSRQCISTHDVESVEKYCELGLKAEEECNSRVWRFAFLHNLVTLFYYSKRFEKLVTLVEEKIIPESSPEVFWMDFYGYAQASAFFLQNYELAIRYGQAYLKIYDQYQRGSLDRITMLIIPPVFRQKQYYEQTLSFQLQSYLFLDQPDQAGGILDLFSISEPDSILTFLQFAIRICVKSGEWTKLSDSYRKAFTACAEEQKIVVMRKQETTLLAVTEEERGKAVEALAELPEDEDPYIRLCRLRRAEAKENQSHGDIVKELNWFFQWDGTWEPLFSDVLFFAMKEKVNIMPLIMKIDPEDLKYYAAGLQAVHSKLPDVIRNYSESYSFENIRGLYWSVCLREKVILAVSDSAGNEENEIGFFEEYAREVAKYMRALYRPELLSSDRISILPRAHRFGWYMGLALSARDCSDGGTYLANLRLALEAYPVMKHPISLLLEQFERDEMQKRKKAEEFRQLANQVKKNIQLLIAEGKLEAAGQITAQLAALMPNDADVIRFQTLTQTQPSMDELVSRLPQ